MQHQEKMKRWAKKMIEKNQKYKELMDNSTVFIGDKEESAGKTD